MIMLVYQVALLRISSNITVEAWVAALIPAVVIVVDKLMVEAADDTFIFYAYLQCRM